MGFIARVVCCVLAAYTGWYLYRNPKKVLDACFKDYEFNYGTSTLNLFSLFGGLVLLLAIVSLIMNIIITTIHVLSTHS